MADFSALKEAIQDYIKQNGNEEITGEKLQTILLSIVNTLGDSAINDLITALNAEVAARQNADGSLEGAINQEGTLRSNADSTLQGNINAEATARENADAALQAAINLINSYIPAQASSSNQLADKAFVNSSIATATATFRGSYNVVTDLELSYNATHAQIQAALATKMTELSITADNNDYAFVQIPTADATPTQIAKTEKYKYNGSAWAFEYVLNNSGFTAAQWAAINSGATLELIGKLSALPTNAELTELLAAKQNVIQDLATIRSGASAGATAVQPATLNAALSNTVIESGVFDLSSYNNGTTYADLSAALTALNALPAAYKKGGMSMKFVRTSDNNYIQARLMANSFTTDVSKWQIVDDEPTVGSDNLVKSGGVYNEFTKTISAEDILKDDNTLIDLAFDYNSWENGVLLPNGSVTAGYDGHTSDFIEVKSSDVLLVKCNMNVAAINPNVLGYDGNKNVLPDGVLLAGGSPDTYTVIPLNSKVKYVRLSTRYTNLHDFYKTNINKILFDKIDAKLDVSNLISLAGYVRQDGVFVPGGTIYACTDYISVEEGDVVFSNCLSKVAVWGLVLFDSNKQVISNNAVSGINLYTVEENVAFVRVSCESGGAFAYKICKESGKYYSPNSLNILLTKLYAESILKLTDGYSIRVNSPSSTVDGKIITCANISTGYFSIDTSTPDKITGYDQICVFKLKCKSITGADSCSVKRMGTNYVIGNIEENDEVTFIYSDKEASFVWFLPSVISTWELLDFVTIWVPDELYNDVYDPYNIDVFKQSPMVLWNAISMYRTYRLLPAVSSYSVLSKESYKLKNINNYFYGKTYCAFGTSITAYSPDVSEGGGGPYCKRVGGYFDMKVVNFGKGSSVCYGTNGNIRTELLAQMPEDTMLVSMLNGANGWITDNIDSTDTDTSVGAYNVSIAYIREHYPSAIIVIGVDAPLSDTIINDMKAIAEKNRVILARTESLVVSSPYRPSGLHLSSLGASAMAAAVIQAAETILTKTVVEAENYTTVSW